MMHVKVSNGCVVSKVGPVLEIRFLRGVEVFVLNEDVFISDKAASFGGAPTSLRIASGSQFAIRRQHVPAEEGCPKVIAILEQGRRIVDGEAVGDLLRARKAVVEPKAELAIELTGLGGDGVLRDMISEGFVNGRQILEACELSARRNEQR